MDCTYCDNSVLGGIHKHKDNPNNKFIYLLQELLHEDNFHRNNFDMIVIELNKFFDSNDLRYEVGIPEFEKVYEDVDEDEDPGEANYNNVEFYNLRTIKDTDEIRLKILKDYYLEDEVFIKLLKELTKYFDIELLNGMLLSSNNKYRIISIEKDYGTINRKFENDIVRIL